MGFGTRSDKDGMKECFAVCVDDKRQLLSLWPHFN